MDEGCKAARTRLKDATRTEYETLVKEAKLTPTQEDILRRHILCGDSVCKISLDTSISERRIKQSLHQAYAAVSRTYLHLNGTLQERNYETMTGGRNVRFI